MNTEFDNTEERTSHVTPIPNLKPLPDLSEWSLEAIRCLGESEVAGRKTFLCKDLENEQLCVVKLVYFNEANWDTIRQVTEREAQALEEVQHPNIPKFIRLIQPETATWVALVQEYIDGAPLAELSLNEEEIWKVATQILEILKVVQRHKRAHLDIKPENILIHRKTGEAFLVDFGVNKHVRSEKTQGATSLLGGTPLFIDPEVLLYGKPPSNRSDLYGLGVALLINLLQLTADEYTDQYGDLYLEVPEKPLMVSESLWNWLVSLISKRVERKPQNATEALEYLVSARTTTISRTLDKDIDTSRSNRDILGDALFRGAVTAVLGVLVMGGVSLVQVFWAPENHQSQPPILDEPVQEDPALLQSEWDHFTEQLSINRASEFGLVRLERSTLYMLSNVELSGLEDRELSQRVGNEVITFASKLEEVSSVYEYAEPGLLSLTATDSTVTKDSLYSAFDSQLGQLIHLSAKSGFNNRAPGFFVMNDVAAPRGTLAVALTPRGDSTVQFMSWNELGIDRSERDQLIQAMESFIAVESAEMKFHTEAAGDSEAIILISLREGLDGGYSDTSVEVLHKLAYYLELTDLY